MASCSELLGRGPGPIAGPIMRNLVTSELLVCHKGLNEQLPRPKDGQARGDGGVGPIL